MDHATFSFEMHTGQNASIANTGSLTTFDKDWKC